VTDHHSSRPDSRLDSGRWSEELDLSSLPAVPDMLCTEFVPDDDGTISVFLEEDDQTGTARELTVIGGVRYSYRVAKVTAKSGSVAALFLVS
jgi:hypothetical protein